MAASSYDDALRRLLIHEGGYSNHPSDPGGPTNFGITIYDYRKYVKPGATAADVKSMQVEEAKNIYRVRYWDALRCDELPAGVDYAAFDYGVNSGIGRARKVLQRVLGVAADGVLGDVTMSAVAVCDPKATIIAICDERLRFLQGLKTWSVFGAGWRRRVSEVKAFSLTIAGQQVARLPASTPEVQQSGKGMVPLARTARQGSTGAIVAAGAAAASQMHGSAVGAASVIGIVACAALAIVAVHAFWRWRQQRQQEAAA